MKKYHPALTFLSVLGATALTLTLMSALSPTARASEGNAASGGDLRSGTDGTGTWNQQNVIASGASGKTVYLLKLHINFRLPAGKLIDCQNALKSEDRLQVAGIIDKYGSKDPLPELAVDYAATTPLPPWTIRAFNDVNENKDFAGAFIEFEFQQTIPNAEIFASVTSYLPNRVDSMAKSQLQGIVTDKTARAVLGL